MRCQIVIKQWQGETIPLNEAIEKYGYNGKAPKCLRHELQRFPQLKGLVGPMWSGDPNTARYETPTMNALLST